MLHATEQRCWRATVSHIIPQTNVHDLGDPESGNIAQISGHISFFLTCHILRVAATTMAEFACYHVLDSYE